MHFHIRLVALFSLIALFANVASAGYSFRSGSSKEVAQCENAFQGEVVYSRYNGEPSGCINTYRDRRCREISGKDDDRYDGSFVGEREETFEQVVGSFIKEKCMVYKDKKSAEDWGELFDGLLP